MRSRFYSAVLLAMATALLLCGAFVARTAHPSNLLLAEAGAPAVQQHHK